MPRAANAAAGSALAAWRRTIELYPDTVCLCCDFELYKNQGAALSRSDKRLAIRELLPDKASHVWICNRCLGSLSGGKLPPMSLLNNLTLGPLFPALGRLIPIEVKLVAGVHLYQSLTQLPYGQKAVTGLSICFLVDQPTIVTHIPRSADDCGTVFVRLPDPKPKQAPPAESKAGNSDAKQRPAADGQPPIETDNSPAGKGRLFLIRPALVRQAAEELLKSNPLYERILLTKDGEFKDSKSSATADAGNGDGVDDQSQVVQCGVQDRFPVLGEHRASRILGDDQPPVFQLSRESGPPAQMLDERYLEALMRPDIFPDGRNHWGTDRAVPLSTNKYFKARLFGVRSRQRVLAAGDLSYLFFAQQINDTEQIFSAASIAMRQTSNNRGKKKGAPEAKLPQQPLTAAGLLGNSAVLADEEIDELCWSFLKKIRGSGPYWAEAKQQLRDMVRKLGPPTWFLTLSCDDGHWIDMAMACGRINRKAAEALSAEQRRKLVIENPDRAAEHFDKRWKSFLNNVLLGPAQPLGRIRDHFYRIEFQMRGSPHTHSLLWTADAPDRTTLEGTPDLCALVTAPDVCRASLCSCVRRSVRVDTCA